MKVVCITPLDHIAEVRHRLSELVNLVYRPNISKKDLRNLLLSDDSITCLFTNPNKQNYLIDSRLLDSTNIRLINTASTGLNHIDLEYCRSTNIRILSLTEDYSLIRSLPSTSELAFGLFLALSRKIPQASDSVKKFNWDYEPFVGRQIGGMTAGIIGYGRLGTYMARYCHAFGMKVIIYDPFKNVFDYEQVEKKELFERSDMISLHVHVKKDTIGIINDKAIDLMNRRPFIINTSRGEIVDEGSIIRAIVDDRISGYGTDVLADEFQQDLSKNDLINLSKNGYNVLITPHIGGMSLEGQKKAYLYAVEKFGKIHE